MCYNLEMESKPPLISRVVIKNYKSIAYCDVRLGALQFLVGRNGSGKSNFLDALAFVRDALLRNNVMDAATRHPDFFYKNQNASPKPVSMHLECNLPDGMTGKFAFEIELRLAQNEDSDNASFGTIAVAREECSIESGGRRIAYYEVRNGEVIQDSRGQSLPAFNDRLYLQNMSGYDEYRSLFVALRGIRFYDIRPSPIAPFEEKRTDVPLSKNGGNVGIVWNNLPQSAKERISRYLRDVVPFIVGIDVKKIGHWQIPAFQMATESADEPWYLWSESMSDGTLRALGVLIALLQERENGGGNFPLLVCIEEPETGLHARAFGALLCAMQEASDIRQVIITTHSADMLDNKEITPDQILPIEMKGAASVIAPMENLTKEMLEEHLTTAGDLLRQDKLKPGENPENSDIFPRTEEQLFGCPRS